MHSRLVQHKLVSDWDWFAGALPSTAKADPGDWHRDTAVENGPGDLPGVPLQHVRLVGAGGQELVALAIPLDQGAAMARVDFVARIAAQVDLHPNRLLLLL